MLRRRATLIVSAGRPVTQFFNRVQENFERKFDGFPAAVVPGQQPAVTEQALDIDYGSIVDDIFNTIINPDTDTPACGDSTVTEILSENAGEWEPSMAVDYYTDVWIDGFPAVEGLEYTVCEQNICPVDIVPEEVKATYVKLVLSL